MRDDRRKHPGSRDSYGDGPSRFDFGNYLSKGFLDEHGRIWRNLIDGEVGELAEALGRIPPRLTNHQLRAFFGHARSIERQILNGVPFEDAYIGLLRMKNFVKDRAGKGKVSRQFDTFISKSVDNADTVQRFQRGLMLHFEAVVALFAYKFPKQ